jgi:1,2-diacylglycerol 3-beta-galactosyltransferase
MSGTEYAGAAATTPAPLLFLIADTGGGHRNAAQAVGQALDRMYPGRFAPVLCDPLSGPGSARLLRWVTGLYGPAIRLAPWLWGAAYHGCNSRPAMGLLGRTLLQRADRPAADAARAHRPVAIVSFHPLTGMAAVSAKAQSAPAAAVVTVVTDLATMHAAWRYADADLIIAPLGAISGHRHPQRPGGGAPLNAVSGHRHPQHPGGRWASAGSPVTREFWAGPLQPDERAILRRSLGVAENRFLVLLTGGGEGSGGIARRAVAILRRFDDVDVVAVCGHNLRLKRRLHRLAARSGGRLTVTGFVRNMADWLRCCDLVVSKAGPGTIAEATCCGVPLLLTSHLPGQEKGNTEFVTGADAGHHVPGIRRLIAEIDRLRDDRAAVDAMRAASARLGRPAAAAHIAELIAGLVPARAPDSRHGYHGSRHTRYDSHNGHDSHTSHSDGARDGDQAEADSMITEDPRHIRPQILPDHGRAPL